MSQGKKYDPTKAQSITTITVDLSNRANRVSNYNLNLIHLLELFDQAISQEFSDPDAKKEVIFSFCKTQKDNFFAYVLVPKAAVYGGVALSYKEAKTLIERYGNAEQYASVFDGIIEA